MPDNNAPGTPVDTPVQNSAPEVSPDNSSKILEVGLKNQASLDSQTTPEDIAINVEKTEQEIIKREAEQVDNLGDRALEANQQISQEATAAAIATIDAQTDIAVQTQENVAKVTELNIDSQESINAARLEAADIQRDRAQEDLTTQQNQAEERRVQLLQREERRIAAQRASAAVRAHMGGMSFSGAGQDYIARVSENAATDMEATIQQFDANSQQTITELRRRRDDTEFNYLNVIDDGERELRGLRLELENALTSIPNIINLSAADKKTAVAQIKEATINRKLAIEKDTFNNISQLNQRNLVSFRNYAQQLKVRQNSALTEVDNAIRSGTFSKLTQSQLKDLSAKTGLSVSELKNRQVTTTGDIIAQAAIASGRDFTPGQIQALSNEYRSYVSQGFTPTQALAFLQPKIKPQNLDPSAFSNKVATGQYFGLSSTEKQALSAKTGIPVADMDAQAKLASDSTFNQIIGKVGSISQDELDGLKGTYDSLISEGVSSVDAVTQLVPQISAITGKNSDQISSFINQVSVSMKTSNGDNLVPEASSKARGLLDTKPGTVVPSRLTSFSPGNTKIKGKECGEFVNDIISGIPGMSRMGSSWASKLSAAPSQEGGVGKVAVWQPSNSPAYQKYGHTGIITGEDGDYWIIKSSNLKPGTVTEDRVLKSKVAGYSNKSIFTDAKEVVKQEGETTVFGPGGTSTTASTTEPESLDSIVSSSETEDRQKLITQLNTINTKYQPQINEAQTAVQSIFKQFSDNTIDRGELGRKMQKVLDSFDGLDSEYQKEFDGLGIGIIDRFSSDINKSSPREQLRQLIIGVDPSLTSVLGASGLFE